ncbi:MAG: hypothetical protein ACI4EJ_06625 [Bacteroides sp.]
MAKINIVLEGKFKGKKVLNTSYGLCIGTWCADKSSVSAYTVIDETAKEEYSFWQGALGEVLFGDMGAILGIGGKQTKEYLISIEWYDGDKSLILIDDEYYKIFVRRMF